MKKVEMFPWCKIIIKLANKTSLNKIQQQMFVYVTSLFRLVLSKKIGHVKALKSIVIIGMLDLSNSKSLSGFITIQIQHVN